MWHRQTLGLSTEGPGLTYQTLTDETGSQHHDVRLMLAYLIAAPGDNKELSPVK
jgi:hypothetical protein